MANGVAVLVDGTKDDELTGRAHVAVEQCFGEPTTFSLRLPLRIMGGDYPTLSDARIGPGSSITIVAETASARACLVHGPVCGQQITFVRGGAGNVVEVLGADESITLDREDKVKVFSQTTDDKAAKDVLTGAGLKADTEPTQASHSDDGRALVQAETDLQFLQRLAARNGYFLWFTSQEDGETTGHFRPPDLAGAPVRLAVNGAKPAFDRLQVGWDVERPTAAVAQASDSHDTPLIGGPVTSSPLKALGTEPFASLAGPARTLRLSYPADKGDELTARATAAVVEGSWFAHARAITTAGRAKAIVQPGTIVDLQGVGKRLSGPWLCSHVRHDITASAHQMDVTLIRNGWGTS
jgi:phage protein D